MDEELLRKIRQAGCSILSIGIETGSQRLMDLIDKKLTLSQVEKAVRLIKRAGIRPRASVILGFPTETRAESLETIKFVCRLPLEQAKFSLATPFPGTKLWDIAVKEGRVDPETVDWRRLSLVSGYAEGDPPYYPEGRDPNELKRLQRMANFRFFFRPRIILGYLKRIKSPADIPHFVRGFLNLAGTGLSRK